MMTIGFQITSLSNLKDEYSVLQQNYIFVSIFHLEKRLSNSECIMPKYPKIPYYILSWNGFKSKYCIILNSY